jgi:hypothetical protein
MRDILEEEHVFQMKQLPKRRTYEKDPPNLYKASAKRALAAIELPQIEQSCLLIPKVWYLAVVALIRMGRVTGKVLGRSLFHVVYCFSAGGRRNKGGVGDSTG